MHTTPDTRCVKISQSSKNTTGPNYSLPTCCIEIDQYHLPLCAMDTSQRAARSSAFELETPFSVNMSFLLSIMVINQPNRTDIYSTCARVPLWLKQHDVGASNFGLF